MTPAALKGKELEALLMEAAEREEKAGRLTMGRYGVHGVIFGGKTSLIPSLPDFEGVLADGRQFILEAKCCNGASFELRDDKFKGRQYKHMALRARFGVRSWLLIHFAERRLTTRIDAGMTVAVPVNPGLAFWRAYEEGTARSLSRDAAQDLGVLVPWRTPDRCRKALPDLFSFLSPF